MYVSWQTCISRLLVPPWPLVRPTCNFTYTDGKNGYDEDNGDSEDGGSDDDDDNDDDNNNTN
jgi:hypothetical protein